MAKGQTVLITGGTQGIGLELARLFARDGHNLILASRDLIKTEAAARKLREQFSVDVLPLAADLSDPAAPQKLFDAIQLAGKHVDILVNNAGFGISGDFLTTQLEYETGMMRLNIGALVRLTKLCLPHMIGNKSGKILNVASIAAFQASPKMSVYGATKAFVLNFSEALAEELAPKNIQVTVLCPGPTKTGFQAKANMKELQGTQAGDPAAVARAGYEGLKKGKRVVVPGVQNKTLLLLERILPRNVVTRLAGRIIRQLSTNA